MEFILCNYKFLIIQMKKSRKQTNLLVGLLETTLQYRTDTSLKSKKKFKDLKTEIRKMIECNQYDEAVMSMLLQNQNFKVRQNLQKKLNLAQTTKGHLKPIFLEIQFSAFKKSSGSLYNRQIWRFSLFSRQAEETMASEKQSAQAIVEFLDYFLSLLFCFTVMPVNVKQHNKYIIDYQFTIGAQQNQKFYKQKFTNISSKKLILEHLNKIHELNLQYHYNQDVIKEQLIRTQQEKNSFKRMDFYEVPEDQQDIRCFQNKKYSYETLDTSQNSRKNSLQSSEFGSKKVIEHYDEDLDMTILSASDDDKHQMKIADSLDQDSGEWEFQMLGTSKFSDDELMLKQIDGICQKFADLQGQYY